MKDRPHPTRRQLLRSAGLAMAASPFVGRTAFAQQPAGSPMRLVCWPMMNGAESGAFYPGGSATQLSLITEPLRKWANLVTFIKGVNIVGLDQPLRGPQHLLGLPHRRPTSRPTPPSSRSTS